MLLKLFGYISAEEIHNLTENAEKVENVGNSEYSISGRYTVAYKNIIIQRHYYPSNYGFTIHLVKDDESMMIAYSNSWVWEWLKVPKGPWRKDLELLFAMIKKDNKKIRKEKRRREKQDYDKKLQMFKN